MKTKQLSRSPVIVDSWNWNLDGVELYPAEGQPIMVPEDEVEAWVQWKMPDIYNACFTVYNVNFYRGTIIPRRAFDLGVWRRKYAGQQDYDNLYQEAIKGNLKYRRIEK